MTITLRHPDSRLAEQTFATTAAAVDIDPAGWQCEAVHQSARSGSYDFICPAATDVSVKSAWDLTYALRSLSEIVDAQPSFETYLDEVAEDDSHPGDTARSNHFTAGRDCPETDLDYDWSPKLVRAPEAWQVPPRPATGKSQGEGIIVGHPDAGYIDHVELHDPTSGEPDRIINGWDFISDDDDPQTKKGAHGLGTASVLMSSDNRVAHVRSVTGVAPKAKLVAYRVTKKRWRIPAPVLLWGGVRRLRKAIYKAVDEANCHVISISLGWFGNAELHEAIKYAEKRNVIVCAAAGNYTGPIVVWPARYRETIALAGCTHDRKRWHWSAHGGSVDFSAPAKDVWKAGNNDAVCGATGTSFSTATAAGIAALWLAHWGRPFLLEKYEGSGFTLTDVFRHVLQHSCERWPDDDDGKYGHGIIDAKACLELDLPTPLAPLFTNEEHTTQLPKVVADLGLDETHVETVSRLVGLPVDELDAGLDGLEDEVVFHVVTSPERRAAFAPGSSLPFHQGRTGPTPPPLRESDDLSDRLRERIARK